MRTGDARAMRAIRALALAAVALLACVARAADVDIALVRMGVGGHVRPGDPTAILVRVTSALTEPVQARIEWSVRNADGDLARYGREVALAPGAPVERWINGVMPIVSSSALASTELVSVVRVLRVEDGRATRVLGERRIDGAAAEEPPVAVEVNEALVGVIGDGRAGLAGISTPTPKASFIASANEVTRIARGIDAGGLPDRWDALSSYEALIWTNAPLQNLAPDQARALLDWVRRGGNLVIVLPESGDPWGLAAGRARNPLAEALPAKAQRRDAVPVADLLPILSKTRELRNAAARTSVWTFAPAAGDAWQPLLRLPCKVDARTGNLVPREGTLDGECVAVRRATGFGFVTVVGIDVDGLDRRSLAAEGIPQSDIFWNRILGRRADTPSAADWNALEAANKLDLRNTIEIPADGGATINSLIGLPTRAAGGVLGLMAAFAVYWVLAGPAGYFVLRAMKRPQYAWLAFVGVAAAATLVAWAATGLAELTTARVQHLTVIDRVDGPGVPAAERGTVRATSWLSAALPGYGGARLALQPEKGAAGADLVWSWFPPPAGNTSGFPDVEAYDVPQASPGAYDLPARATSTVLAAQWMGAAPPQWDALPAPLRTHPLQQRIQWTTDGPTILLTGMLQHELPVALTDVTLVHVTPFRPDERRTAGQPPTIRPSGAMPSFGRMIRMDKPWEPRTPLDLARTLYAAENAEGVAPQPARKDDVLSVTQQLARAFRGKISQSTLGYVDPGAIFDASEQVEMRWWFGMLTPPAYVTTADTNALSWRGPSARYQRDFGRNLDLGARFATPCLIVVGRVQDRGASPLPMPFPLTIDGREPEADGTTWVRVVIPLPEDAGAMVPPMP